MGQIKSKKYTSKNQVEVVIRTVDLNDAEAYLNLGKSIMSEHIYSMTQPDELSFTIEEEQKWLQSIIDNPNHLALVAEIKGKVVGQLDFSNGHKRRIAHTGEFGMGVYKDYRGNGVGSFLLKELVNWAQNNPTIDKVNLSVHSTNERAIMMYTKHGFQKEGLRTKDLKYSQNEFVETVLMGLFVG